VGEVGGANVVSGVGEPGGEPVTASPSNVGVSQGEAHSDNNQTNHSAAEQQNIKPGQGQGQGSQDQAVSNGQDDSPDPGRSQVDEVSLVQADGVVQEGSSVDGQGGSQAHVENAGQGQEGQAGNFGGELADYFNSGLDGDGFEFPAGLLPSVSEMQRLLPEVIRELGSGGALPPQPGKLSYQGLKSLF